VWQCTRSLSNRICAFHWIDCDLAFTSTEHLSTTQSNGMDYGFFFRWLKGSLGSLVSSKFVIFLYRVLSVRSLRSERCLRDDGVVTDYSTLLYRYTLARQLSTAGLLMAPMSKHSQWFRLLSFRVVSLRCTLVTDLEISQWSLPMGTSHNRLKFTKLSSVCGVILVYSSTRRSLFTLSTTQVTLNIIFTVRQSIVPD
jgi:hypothetical protein